MSILDTAIDLTDIPQEKWREEYIGNGYRSCCYQTHNRQGMIVLFGYDKANNPQTFFCPWKSHIKFNVKYETKERDIYGRYVETKYFDTSKARKEYIETIGDSIHIIECDRPEVEFLHAMFDEIALEKDFNKQPLRTFFYDIETEIGKTFEYPKTAGQRINAITIYDTKTEKFYVWSLSIQQVNITEDPLTEYPKDKFEIFYFNNSESRMLQNLLNWWERNYPDVLCGYNSQAFDLPYIVRRIENVLGEKEAKRLSPVGRYTIRQNNLENARANKQAEILVDISGIFDADFLILYRDKFKVKSPLDGGYSLNNVGDAEGLGRKVEYEGSLKEFYETDWSRFINYNIRDVELLYRLEKKCKLVNLARAITSTGLNNYNSIYSSISYLVGSLSQFAKTRMGRTMVSYSKKDDSKLGKYEGAYVFEPIPGIYRGGIATIDFNSLYPNTIRSVNISPETNIGHLNDDWFAKTEDEHPVLSDIKEFNLNLKNVDILKYIVKNQLFEIAKKKGVSFEDKTALKTLIEENNLISSFKKSIRVTREQINGLIKDYCIITRNNDIIVKHKIKRGVVAEWCGFFFNKRKATKKEKAGVEKRIDNHEYNDDQTLIAMESEVQNLDNIQQSIKIMINSIYGCLGCSFSPIYDADLAQSITRQGKFCNRNASLFLKNKYTTIYSMPSSYVHTISGDTDSQFSNIACISESFAKKYNLPKNLRDWPDEKKLELWDFVENMVNEEVTPFVRNLVKEWCHTDEPDSLRYGLEYLGDVGIYQAKKNYACHHIVEEGRKIVDKIVYKGIELKKGNLDKAVKGILAPVYENVLKTDYKESEFEKYIRESYEKFCKMPVEDISFWKGYNTERKSSGFLEMEKVIADDGHTVGTTSISAAGTYYNQLLEKLGIGNKYEEILLGDKVRFCYVKCQKYPIKYIAFKNRWPTEFNSFMQIDYPTMFEKTVLKPLERFFLASGFKKFDPSKNYAEDIDDL